MDQRMDKQLSANRLRLRHISCFVCVAQEHTLAKAAEKLSLSQPAVSKTISELEQILGARLFERGRLGAQLTHDGESFLAHAVPVLQAIDAAKNSVGPKTRRKQEAVYLGALPTVAPDLLPPALAKFRHAQPDARVLIHTAANLPLLEMLQAGEVDFVLGRMTDPQAMLGLSFELLYAEPLALVVRAEHPLCAMDEIALSDVVRFPLIVATRGTVPRHNTENFLRSRGARLPANCVETLSVSVGRALARQSDSVWFTPAGSVRDDLRSGSMIALPVATQGTEEAVGLLHRSEGTLSRPALSFMKLLRGMAASLAR